MKTTVVPAQITTVEDRIAGSLTFPQIVLLIIPLLTSTAIYACVPHRMHISILKAVLIGSQLIFFGGLAIRFRGKIIADWLVIYLRYSLRPRRYIFTKNDVVGRDIDIITPEKQTVLKKVEKARVITPLLNAIPDTTRIDRLLENPSLSVSLKLAKKGGLDVSLKTIDR